MGLFDLFRTSKRAKTKIEGTAKVANSKPQQNLKVWMCACGRENPDYVSACVCGINKRNTKYCNGSVQALACKNIPAEPQDVNVGKDISSNDTNKKIKWTSQLGNDTTEISITSKGDTVIRTYLHCRVDEDEVFNAVTMAGANILSISMTEVHDWDDREWYVGGFGSYEAYLSDEEHDKYICEWSADAEYSGIAITLKKPYNMVCHGLFFCYDSRDEARLAEFFEEFDEQCCRKKTIVDERDITQKWSNANNTPKKEPIEKVNTPLLKKDVPEKQTVQKARDNLEPIVSTVAMNAGQLGEDKMICMRETKYVDDSDFYHHSRDIYYLSAKNQVKKETTSTRMDAHNAARSTRNVFSYQISEDELNKDMHASDHRLGTQRSGNFSGAVVRVLIVKYSEGFGFEKEVERKAIMRFNGKYFLQTIIRRVVAEGNGRPITQYSEYVYPISTSDVNVITPENIEANIVPKAVFQDVKSEAGVGF